MHRANCAGLQAECDHDHDRRNYKCAICTRDTGITINIERDRCAAAVRCRSGSAVVYEYTYTDSSPRAVRVRVRNYSCLNIHRRACAGGGASLLPITQRAHTARTAQHVPNSMKSLCDVSSCRSRVVHDYNELYKLQLGALDLHTKKKHHNDRPTTMRRHRPTRPDI